jgi:hypothetical protein
MPAVVVIRQPKTCLLYPATMTRGWRRCAAKVMARARNDSGSISTSTRGGGDLTGLVRADGDEWQRPQILATLLIERRTAATTISTCTARRSIYGLRSGGPTSYGPTPSDPFNDDEVSPLTLGSGFLFVYMDLDPNLTFFYLLPQQRSATQTWL